MASLSNKIRQYVNAEIDFLKDVILQDDSNGQGAYIKEWNLDIDKPTQAQLDALDAQADFNVAITNLRTKRNKLLADTDYLALSDNTMSAEMTTYRQSLRDITNGLTTVADVEAVVFPTKP
jgi:exosome complex RNA-binding protein Rrp4